MTNVGAKIVEFSCKRDEERRAWRAKVKPGDLVCVQDLGLGRYVTDRTFFAIVLVNPFNEDHGIPGAPSGHEGPPEERAKVINLIMRNEMLLLIDEKSIAVSVHNIVHKDFEK